MSLFLLGLSAGTALLEATKNPQEFSRTIDFLKLTGYAALMPAASVATCCVVTGLRAVKALCQNGCAAAKRVCADSKELIGDAIYPYPRVRQWRARTLRVLLPPPARRTVDGL